MRIIAGVLSICLMIGSIAVAAEVPADGKAEVKIEKAVDPEAMVVKVNGHVVKEKDVSGETDKRVAAQAKRMPPGMEINDWMRNQIRTSVVDMLVEKTLLEQKLTAKKLEVTDEDVTKEIETIAKQQNVKMEDVPAEIAKYGMTMDDLKGQIRMSVQREKLIETEMKDKDVKDEEVKTFYDDNPQYFERPEQVHASHILVKTEEGASIAQKAEARKKAEELLKQVKAGGDFAALAKAHSACPSAERGGDLGEFGRGQMVPAFEEAAFALKDGQVSDIVETQFGYHIIKTVKHLEARKEPFDEVKEQIKDHLVRQKRGQFWENYSKAMRDEAKIEYSAAETKLREESAQPPMMPGMMPQG